MNPPKPRRESQREDGRRGVLALLEQAAGHDLKAAMLGQSGALQRSLHDEHGRNAAIHQRGAKKGRLIPWGDLPARPLLGVRDPERKQTRNALLNHLRVRPKRPRPDRPATTSSAPKPSPSSGKTTATTGSRQPRPATGP